MDTIVTIYLNEAEDLDGRSINFDGYLPGQPIDPKVTYNTELKEHNKILNQAFKAFNVGWPGDNESLQNAIKAYRNARNRSLSVGDVIRIDDGANDICYAVEPLGFKNIQNLKHDLWAWRRYGYPTGKDNDINPDGKN